GAALALGVACAAGGSTGDGGSGGGPGGSGGAGGAEVSGDPLPKDAVSFFAGPGCPTGWQPFAPAVGRTILPTIGSTEPGATFGEPLESGEDRLHAHDVSMTFTLPDQSFAGVVGGGNPLAPAGDVEVN